MAVLVPAGWAGAMAAPMVRTAASTCNTYRSSHARLGLLTGFTIWYNLQACGRHTLYAISGQLQVPCSWTGSTTACELHLLRMSSETGRRGRAFAHHLPCVASTTCCSQACPRGWLAVSVPGRCRLAQAGARQPPTHPRTGPAVCGQPGWAPLPGCTGRAGRSAVAHHPASHTAGVRG